MIQIHYYKIIINITLFSMLAALDIAPIQEHLKEKLEINNKGKEYYLLYKESLEYNVIGPQRIEIISRRAIPKDSSKKYKYGYRVLLNNSAENQVEFNKRIMETISSLDHPDHGYTQAGKCVINIPDGNYMLTIQSIKKGKPILIRLLDKKFKRSDGITIQPKLINSINSVEFIINEKKRNYYEIYENSNLEIETYGQGTIALYTRSKFDSKVSGLTSYQLDISKNGNNKYKLIEFLDNNQFDIKNKPRIFQYNLDQDTTLYNVKLVNGSKPVYLRILQHIPYE